MQDIMIDQADAGGVMVVTLARPDQRNAMSVAMVDELIAMLGSEAGRCAGAIVIRGEGRGFCAGSDLSALSAMTLAQRSRFEADCGDLARAITAHPRPVIAAVHGFAIGGGLTLAAACDVIITAPDAKWSLPEVPIGLFPAWGLEAVTTRVGRTFARRLSFGVDLLTGEEAAARGLADNADPDPHDAATAIATQLAALPRDQTAAVKEYFGAQRASEEADRHANRLFLAACQSDAALRLFERFRR